MKAMLAAAVLLLVRRYGVFAGESIWAPDRVVSVSFMCGMVTWWQKCTFASPPAAMERLPENANAGLGGAKAEAFR